MVMACFTDSACVGGCLPQSLAGEQNGSFPVFHAVGFFVRDCSSGSVLPLFCVLLRFQKVLCS